ncbi:MAG: urate hydroxylase PuuD [Actinomycetota bacterium]
MEALATDILIIFKRESVNGWEFLFRWAHVVVGIAWIGLLYYFNFVQTPAFAELDAGARNQATDKLASRALWWLRWAAVATLVFGLLILLAQKDGGGGSLLFSGDYWKTYAGISIAAGILLGLTMFANVWLVIWPNQKKVIANARNVLAGGDADPAAAAAGRRALMASRQNAIFSFTMLFFMVGTSHFFGQWAIPEASGSDRAIFWAVTIILWLVLELNALGVLGGTAPGGPRVIYDTHKAAIITGLVLVVVWYVIWIVAFGTP